MPLFTIDTQTSNQERLKCFEKNISIPSYYLQRVPDSGGPPLGRPIVLMNTNEAVCTHNILSIIRSSPTHHGLLGAAVLISVVSEFLMGCHGQSLGQWICVISISRSNNTCPTPSVQVNHRSRPTSSVRRKNNRTPHSLLGSDSVRLAPDL